MASEVEQLRAELDALRAENVRLRDDAMAATLPLPDMAPPAPQKKARRWSWRAFLSAICIVLAGILVPLSVVGAWARTELVSEEAFVSTFAPLADDPGVQQLIIDQATTAINDSIDVESLTGDLFDGLETLDLPPRAVAALGLLREPAASGVQSLIDGSVTRVVESDAFSAVWRTALVASHRALVATAAGGTSNGAVTIGDDGTLGIQLAPIIEELKSRMIEQGIGVASLIPAIDKTIVIVQDDALLLVGTVYGLAVTVGWWLPVVSLALFGLGIALARRRSTAVLGTGIAIAIGAGLLVVVLNTVGVVAGLNAPALGIPAATLNTIIYTIVGAMRDTAVVLTFLGVVVALAGWLAGRSTSAARVRTVSASLSTRARRSLRGSGVNTGRVGEWLYAQRVLVRAVILVLTLLILFFQRPLSIGDIILTVVIALAVWLVATLAQRTPDDDDVDGIVESVPAADPEEPEDIDLAASDVTAPVSAAAETADAVTEPAATSGKKPRS